MAPGTHKSTMKSLMKRSAKQHPIIETAPNDDEAATPNANVTDTLGVAAPEVDAEGVAQPPSPKPPDKEPPDKPPLPGNGVACDMGFVVGAFIKKTPFASLPVAGGLSCEPAHHDRPVPHLELGHMQCPAVNRRTGKLRTL